MVAILAIVPSIVVLWVVMWITGLFGVRLAKWSWKKLPLAVLGVCATFGIPVLQVYLLTTLESGKFARDVFIYIVLAEYPPAIVLGFVAAIREDRARKRSETPLARER